MMVGLTVLGGLLGFGLKETAPRVLNGRRLGVTSISRPPFKTL